jgi:hypothetical protein
VADDRERRRLAERQVDHRLELRALVVGGGVPGSTNSWWTSQPLVAQ